VAAVATGFVGLAFVLALGEIEVRFLAVGIRAVLSLGLVSIAAVVLMLLDADITSNAANFLTLDSGALLGVLFTDILTQRLRRTHR
jgi:hypothetical protein